VSCIRWSLIALFALPLVACGTLLGNYNVGMSEYNHQHYDKAAYWFTKATAEGDPSGEYMLGIISQNGLGRAPKDLVQACGWYAKAAGRGMALAINNLGACYESRDFPQRNMDYAVALYSLAARKGDAMAQGNLARLGRPIPAADLLPQQQGSQNSSADGLAALAVIGGAAAVASKGYSATPSPVLAPPALNLHCTSQIAPNGQTAWTNCY
jgi:TPR repeat protein